MPRSRTEVELRYAFAREVALRSPVLCSRDAGLRRAALSTESGLDLPRLWPACADASRLDAPHDMVSRFLTGLFCICVSVSESSAQSPIPIDWPTIGFTQVVGGLSSPTDIANAGDGSNRLFVAEQAGRIRIIQNNLLLAAPFLDIHNRIQSGFIEQGLLGIAFPPGFASKQYFYVDYTRLSDGAGVVSRFRMSSDPNIADPASEEVILIIPQPFTNHNGGQIHFGPDGYLYIGKGDGGSEDDPNNQGQTTNTLLGKLLRIDTESGVTPYAVPPSNPFVGNAAYRPEIWALGLRNPWRYSFDRQTGDVYIGDVGGNLAEEVDFQAGSSTGGQNYGWRIMEGNYMRHDPGGIDVNTFTAPVVAYDHGSSTGYIVIGGYVYRGPAQSRFDGVYLYGDYSTGNIWGLKYDGTIWQTQKTGTLSGNPSTFGEDEAGRLYIADYPLGRIYLLTDTLAANPPSYSPPAGTYADVLNVRLSSDSNSTIYYTTNGTTPTTSSSSITSGGTVPVTSNGTLTAFAVKSGFANSSISSGAYSFRTGTPSVNPPAGSTFTVPSLVSIATATSGATIRYTLDGSAPTASSPVYSAPVLVTPPVTLTAQAFRTNFQDSSIASAFYGLRIVEAAQVQRLAGSGQRGYFDGPALSAQFSNPLGLCADTVGNVYVVDSGNNAIRKISSTGDVTTIAGGSGAGYVDAVGTSAKFSAPIGICIDQSGNLYVSDSKNYAVRKIAPNASVSTAFLFGSPQLKLSYLERDNSGNFYVGWGSSITKISGSTTVSLASGSSQAPFGIGLAPDGTLYASAFLSAISRIAPGGATDLFAGNPNIYGYSDGPRAQARFDAPQDLCVDVLGSVYVADYDSIRVIRSNGRVSTLLGGYGRTSGICVTGAGIVYVADPLSQAIFKVTPVDWDGDGLPDAEDADGDGPSNVAEFFAGTNPLDPKSTFRVQSATMDVSGNFAISWASVAGKRYQAQFSNDLLSWQNLGTVQVGTGQPINVTDANAKAHASRRFYRVIVGVP